MADDAISDNGEYHDDGEDDSVGYCDGGDGDGEDDIMLLQNAALNNKKTNNRD